MPTVAIAGATGFVGRALCRELAQGHRVIALSRRPEEIEGVESRACDLFDLAQVEAVLTGADVAIYLVHSMLPSARLTQASFADLDLLLADNFARAAAKAGVERILYVGGLVPEDGPLSPHLASRKEVEETLGSRGAALSALRCGIIVGPGSSSLWILVNLVRRLPAMILPRWTESSSQPIALADLVRAVRIVLEEPARFTGAFDLGGPDRMTYRTMLARTAACLGRRRLLLGVPLFTSRLSRLWVSIFGSAPLALVTPLVESLRHDMRIAPNPLQERIAPEAKGFEAALADALDASGRPLPPPSSIRLSTPAKRRMQRARSVRSVQRLPLPTGRDARWAAQEYLRFLPRFMRPWIRVETDAAGGARFFLAGTRLCLLALQLAPGSEPDRTELEIVGGALLARSEGPRGRFELREALGGRALLAAIHDYRPALPWPLYQATQARVHLAVMRGFGRRLARSNAETGRGGAQHAAR
jgi:uncharacterized protein YbjT (DUF2867 family)